MLFNSYPFLFAFLPLALVGHGIASRLNQQAVILWLCFISLVFYAWSRPNLLIILTLSIAFNYLAAALLSQRIPNPVKPSHWLYVAIAVNLSVLAYYKYFFPLLNFILELVSHSTHRSEVALPLGISFFTFTQIAFLVDLEKKQVEQYDFQSYLLFVSFFPHLIAGPILSYREMMPQFRRIPVRLNADDISVGFTWFALGLSKKVLLADKMALTASPIFSVQEPLPASVAWVGALSYMLQLYFDFSGYSDMALGLARMFSIDFPLNFNSPYKSSSIIEFCQRWHMTLGRYIFQYVFNPLVRAIRERRIKKGLRITRRDRTNFWTFIEVVVFPLSLTMLIAGVWHGAGFHFLVFGLISGFYMSINYAWRQFYNHLEEVIEGEMTSFNVFKRMIRRCISILLTFFCIMISLVFFRAENTKQAMSMIFSMFVSSHSASLPFFLLPPGFNLRKSVASIAIGLFVVWGFPNTQQILSRFRPSLQKTAWNEKSGPQCFLWKPSANWAVITAILFLFCLVRLQQASAFLYFAF